MSWQYINSIIAITCIFNLIQDIRFVCLHWCTNTKQLEEKKALEYLGQALYLRLGVIAVPGGIANTDNILSSASRNRTKPLLDKYNFLHNKMLTIVHWN